MYAAVRKSNAETKASTIRRKVPAKYPQLMSAINPAKPKAAIMYPITLEIPYERTLNILTWTIAIRALIIAVSAPTNVMTKKKLTMPLYPMREASWKIGRTLAIRKGPAKHSVRALKQEGEAASASGSHSCKGN